MDPAAKALADAVVAIVVEALGEARVLGAYLHGSAILGGLRPTSDVDVLVVAATPTTDAERRAIVGRLLEISGRRATRGPARPVELTMVTRDAVQPWNYPPTMELLYGEWLRDDFEAGRVPDPAPNPDLAPVLTMVLAGDRPLLGPRPAAILAPVPPADLRRAIAEGVPGLLADLEPDTRNVLLTLARIWATLATGEIRSKGAAATWAMERLAADGPAAGASRAALARARSMYLDGVDDGPADWAADLPAVRATAARLAAEIQAEEAAGR